MATAKKAPVKKKPAAKKVTAKKTVASKKEPAKMKSFRVSANDPTFTTFTITRQTVYWVILVSFIVFVQLWILSLQIDVANQIESQINSLQLDNE